MTERDTNDLDLISDAELESALALLAPPQNAREMAAAVAAIPVEDRAFYAWAHEVVLAAGAVSPELAARIREHYGRTPEEQERIAQEQRLFFAWRETTAGAPIRMTFCRDDVVIDTRHRPAGLDRAFTVPTADPPEWRTALGLVRVSL